MLHAGTFAATALALLAAPGPTNMLLASAGATVGRGALSLLTAGMAGYVIAVGSLVVLAGPVLAAAPALLVTSKFVVAAWLFWTGLSLWRNSQRNSRPDGLVGARTVFVTTLLNPKTLVIAFGLMPPAAAGYEALIFHLADLTFLTTLTGCFWIAGGAVLARVGAGPYAAKTTAVTLGGFGAFLLGSAISQ